MKKYSLKLFIFQALFLTACTLGPEYQRPEVALPSSFTDLQYNSVEIANLPWWEMFKDDNLQGLIKIALSENKDLSVAAARIEASKAILGITRADQFPRIDLAGNSTRTDPSDEIISIINKPINNFGVFGNLSFELDFWGRLRKATEAQRAELLSSEYAKRALTVSLVAEVAANYYSLIGLDQRLEISNKTYKNRGGSTGLIRARFEKGMIPELDVNQAEIEEADVGSSVTVIERQRRVTENALAVLLGRASVSVPRGAPLSKQNFGMTLPETLPAALLEKRPDILASEEKVKAAVARIGVAEAGRLPTFSLLGIIGLQSRESNDFFNRDAFTWSIGGNMLGPLLDWGQSSSQVELSKAEAHAAYKQYEQTVIQSVREVEDALAGVRTFKTEVNFRSKQTRSSKNAAKLSRARYDDGVSAYIEVLDIERSLFEAELGASLALENYYISIIQLYKALGGGWEPYEGKV